MKLSLIVNTQACKEISVISQNPKALLLDKDFLRFFKTKTTAENGSRSVGDFAALWVNRQIVTWYTIATAAVSS